MTNIEIPVGKRTPRYRFFEILPGALTADEIAVLPLVLGLPAVAVFFSLLNGIVLWVRIREENKALATLS